MFEVLNDPWGLFALSLVLGFMLSVLGYAFVLIIKYIISGTPKRGASKMSDRQFRKYLREVSNDQIR